MITPYEMFSSDDDIDYERKFRCRWAISYREGAEGYC